MAKKRFRKKRFRKRNLKSTVHKIVKKEIGKTRELKKLVSFVMSRPIRSLNTEFVGSANTPMENTVVYSLTGGRIRDFDSLDHPQNPDANSNKSLFAMRPMFANSNFSAVDGAGGGGIVDSSSSTGNSSLATQGVHMLQGRECYLKNFYCNIRLNNQGHPAYTTTGGTDVPAQDPTDPMAQYVRVLVVSTRRPLGGMRTGGTYNSLARQLLLQYHAGDGTNTQAPVDINADSVTGFLNLQVIKKVYYDKMIWMGDGDKANFNTQWIKRLKIPINKKARWNYNYETGADPDEGYVSFEGPWIYLIAYSSNQTSQSTEVCPRINLSSILTFYDE